MLNVTKNQILLSKISNYQYLKNPNTGLSSPCIEIRPLEIDMSFTIFLFPFISRTIF